MEKGAATASIVEQMGMAKKPTKKPKRRVELFSYIGYNGSFALVRQMLWKCEIVGANGRRWSGNKASWHGNPDKRYPFGEAKAWAAFTGWPMVDLGHLPKRDDAERG